MNQNSDMRMEDIIRILELWKPTPGQDGATSHYLEIMSDGREVVLSANREGLVWLALQVLKIADQKPGAHLHIDEAGMADRAQIDLVIANVASPTS